GPDRLAEGLLPPDPLPGSGEEQQSADRCLGKAATGRSLREGRVSLARPAITVERRHHQAVGRRGRGECEVGDLLLEVVPDKVAGKARVAAPDLAPRNPPLPTPAGEGGSSTPCH